MHCGVEENMADKNTGKLKMEETKPQSAKTENAKTENAKTENAKSEKMKSKPKKTRRRYGMSPVFVLVILVCFAACFGAMYYLQYKESEKTEILQNKVDAGNVKISELTTVIEEQENQIDELVQTAKAEQEEFVDKNSLGRDFYRKLKHGQDVSILIVGDSIGNGDGASDDAHKWENLLKAKLEETYHSGVSITNVSMGGTTSFAGFARLRALDDEEKYDLAIVCYGQNDEEENFAEYYESLIQAILIKYDDIDIISILESSQREYTSKMETIKWICGAYSIPVADTIGAFNASEIPYAELTAGGVHPNDTGQIIYEETVEGVIRDKLSRNRLTEWNLNYGDAKFYSFENCIRVDDTTWKANVSYGTGRIGIYRDVLPGESKITVTIDDEQKVQLNETWPLDVVKTDFYEISKESYEVTESILIEFDSREVADCFWGILVGC